MKKHLRILFISFVAILMLFTSCNDEFKQLKEGSVNEYIYPYLKFSMNEDGSTCSATVVAGARIHNLVIPEKVSFDDEHPFVVEFKGFENPEDASELITLILPSSMEKIDPDTFQYATNLESVKTLSSDGYAVWAELPPIEKDGYHFLGWFACGGRIHAGMPVEPGCEDATPMWAPHDLMKHEGLAPTCTTPGWNEYYTCTGCDYSTKVEIPALGHDVVHVPAKESSCTESGNREYWKCNRCEKMFSDAEAENEILQVELPPVKHILHENEYVPPRCDSFGIKEHWVCENCHEKFWDAEGLKPVSSDSDLIIDMVPHTPKAEWSSDADYHWHVCAECGNQLDHEAHAWNKGEIIVKPTDTSAGKARYTCTVCNYIKEEVLPPENHPFEVYLKQTATCDEDGWIIWKCSDCGLTYTEILPKLNHKNNVLVEKKAPSCTEPGHEKYWKCNDCGKIFTDSACTEETTLDELQIDALGHLISEKWTYDETYHWHECIRENCDYITEKIEHSYTEYPDNVSSLRSSATCTEPAVYYRSCECGEVHEDMNDTFTYGEPLGHHLVHHPATDKPCGEDGHIEYWSCDREDCGLMFSDAEGKNQIYAIRADHTPGGYIASPSGHVRECAVCHEKLGEILPHRGKWCPKPADPVNHTEKYKHELRCEVCGYNLGREEDHEWTYVDNKKVCKVCGYVCPEKLEGDGGFGVDVEVSAPKGHLNVENQGNGIWLFSFIDDNSKNPPDSFNWYVNGELKTETGSSYLLEARRPASFTVMCIFRNKAGGGSASATITGNR